MVKKGGGQCSMAGGRRSRRGGGQCGSMGGKRRRTLRGGMYGVGSAITPGALEYGAAYTGAADPKTGAAVPDPTLKGTPSEGGYTGLGGRRRSRKGSRKSRRKSRKMRGGAGSVSMGTVGYGYTGTGVGGLANATQYTTQGNAF